MSLQPNEYNVLSQLAQLGLEKLSEMARLALMKVSPAQPGDAEQACQPVTQEEAAAEVVEAAKEEEPKVE